MPEPSYSYGSRVYEMPITKGPYANGRPFPFRLPVVNGEVLWTPDGDHQVVQSGYRGDKGPAQLRDITREDVRSILRHIKQIQTKEGVRLRDVKRDNGELEAIIFADLQERQRELSVSQ